MRLTEALAATPDPQLWCTSPQLTLASAHAATAGDMSLPFFEWEAAT